MSVSLSIGQLLLKAGHIDSSQLASALAYQQTWGGKLGNALVALRILPERLLLKELARQHKLPFIEIGDLYVAPTDVRLVPEKLIRTHRLLPLGLCRDEGRSLFLATSEPQNLTVLNEVTHATGRAVRPVFACERDLERAIVRHLAWEPRPSAVSLTSPNVQ